MFKRLWNWLMSPFRKVPAQEEVRDEENNAIVAYKRPEEMAVTRWVAGVKYTVVEDIEDATEAVSASSPLILIALAYMGMIWILMLLSVVFGMAMKGVGLGLILAKVLYITYIMGAATLVLLLCYVVTTTLGVIIMRRMWRMLNWVLGHKDRGFVFSAANLFRKFAF